MKQEFKKSDLKSGMWVVTRIGKHYFVMKDCESKTYGTGWLSDIEGKGGLSLNNYDENLCVNSGNNEFDIVEVKKATQARLFLVFDKALTIWMREEPKTLTQAEHDFIKMFEFEMWIARDTTNELYIYTKKPFKNVEIHEWDITGACYTAPINSDCFQFIKWTDEEPYSTKEMLKWEIKEEE